MEIFLILFFIIFFSLATLGYGQLLSKIIGNSQYELSLGEIGFLGFFFISFISLFFHFFIPLNTNFNTLLYILGIFFLIIETKNKNIKILKNFKHYKFLLIILIVSLIMFIDYKPNEDFGYYHLPYITNLIHEKIIFGLSNLQLNQGWNSIWLNIKSTYHIKYLKFDGVFFSNVVFYLFSSLILFEINFKNRNINKSIFVFTFTLFFLIFLNLKFSRLNTYGLDVPSNYMVIYTCVLFFLYFCRDSEVEEKFNIFEYLVLFCLFSVSFRIINILTLILPLIIFIIEKITLKKIFKSKIILISVLFFILFLSQQIIYTGCLLIPNKLTCVDSLLWFDPNIIEYFDTDTSKVNKSFQSYTGQLSRDEYLSNFSWVNNWYDRHKIEIFEHIGTFLSPIILYILMLSTRNKVIEKFSYISTNNYILIFLLTALFIWFLKAPVIRFGTIYIQASILILILILFKNKLLFLPHKNIIILLISISLIGNLIKNTNRLFLGIKNNQIIPKIPKINYHSNNIFDIKLNYPISNPKIAKSELCWNVPTLCRMGGFNDLDIFRLNNYLFIKKK